MSDHVHLIELVNAICKPGTQWKMSNGEACSVKANKLNKNAKIWHYFVGARFMPSSHLSDVTRNLAILIYYILSGKSIDVESIIHASILHSVRGMSVGLYFPSLSTALCGKAGFIWGLNEEVIHYVHAIDKCMMVTVKGWDRSASSSSTSTAGPPPQPQPQWPTMVIGRLECLELEVTQFCTYQRGCNWALTQMMQALALHVGIDLDTFPKLPTDLYDTAQ